MTDSQYTLLNDLVVQPLKNLGAEVYIFGSRAKGKHHSHSDVDLLFRVPTGDIPLHVLSDLKEAIEESRFPYIVDLVNEKNLATSYRSSVIASMRKL